MRCLFCKKGDTKVLESRDTDDALRRRRECLKCEKRFTTYERVEATNLLVIKRSGTREGFNREKLRSGILHACEKRSVTNEQIERMLDRIEEQAKKSRTGEISSETLGQIVMRELKRIDKVAYIRFASVYLDFKDPEDFQEALNTMRKR